jgi:quercetin dioxygenase-like cupin family protein
VVQEGRIRFEIEGPEGRFQTIEAHKGSYVYAPERHLHALEVIGDAPAIRFEVTLADATAVYEQPPAKTPGIEYIPEFWIVLRGTLRWTIEGLPPLLASEGDIVYAMPGRFHKPEFAGDGPSCRLTSSTYPAANHIYDAQ